MIQVIVAAFGFGWSIYEMKISNYAFDIQLFSKLENSVLFLNYDIVCSENIDIYEKFHSVQKCVNEGLVAPLYTNSCENVSDTHARNRVF